MYVPKNKGWAAATDFTRSGGLYEEPGGGESMETDWLTRPAPQSSSGTFLRSASQASSVASMPVEPGESGRARFLRSRSNIERMETVAEDYTKEAVKVMGYGRSAFDREMLKSIAAVQQRRLVGCLSLPFSIAFFLLFALSAYLHEDITNVFLIESGLRGQLGSGLTDVETIEDVWNWLNESLVPNLFQQRDEEGEPISDKARWSHVLVYNRLHGPVVLEQLRSEKGNCSGGEGIAGHMVCYPMASRSREGFGRLGSTAALEPSSTEYAGGTVTPEQRLAYYESAFRVAGAERRLRIAREHYLPRLPSSQPDGDAFRASFYANTNYSLIQEHLNFLRDGDWLDLQSKTLAVKALLINAEVGRPRLEQVSIIFRFSRGGGVFGRITLESIFLRLWHGLQSMVADALWLVMLLGTTFSEAKHMVQAARARGLCRHLQRFRTAFAGLVVTLGWACVGGYFIQALQLQEVVANLRLVIGAEARDLPADLNAQGADLLDSADVMVQFSGWFRILIAEYHLVLMFRFFTAFRVQPRLGIVTSTLESSLVDSLHFLLVLLPTFMAFAVSGCFIFGRRLEEFSTFAGAIGVCLKMLIEGEYDWPELSAEHYVTALLWSWGFMLVLVLLMLNMVLAIVLDVYTDRMEHSGHVETVWQTLAQMVHRIRNLRQWIPNEQLVQGMQHLPATFTPEELQEHFPTMCEAQLEGLLAACWHQCEGGSSLGGDAWVDNMKMLTAVQFGVDQVAESVRQMSRGPEREEAGRSLAAADEDEGWLPDLDRQVAVQNHLLLSLQWSLQQLRWQGEVMDAMYGPGNQIPCVQQAYYASHGSEML